MDINVLWPELAWIKGKELREATTKTWELALEKSVLTPEDLNRISDQAPLARARHKRHRGCRQVAGHLCGPADDGEVGRGRGRSLVQLQGHDTSRRLVQTSDRQPT